MSMNELNLENLFTDESELIEANKGEEGNNEEKNITETEINPNSLFESEGVGSGEEGSEGGDTEANESEAGQTSPKNKKSIYSTIASAFKEDGVFSDLSDEELQEVKDAESFSKLMEKTIEAKLTDTQRRIKEALEGGIEPDEVQGYEKTIEYLDNINSETISEENEEGEKLRKQIIFQDFINKGFSEERAKKALEKSFSSGSDIEDALDALESNKEYYKQKYSELREGAKEANKVKEKDLQKQQEELQKTILGTEEPIKNLKISEKTRKQAWDNIIKPVYTDEKGNKYNAIQKYAKENPGSFQHILSVFFTLTDGFKNIEGIAKGEVKRQVGKSLKELEHTLNSTSVRGDGSLNYMGDTSDINTYEGLTVDV